MSTRKAEFLTNPIIADMAEGSEAQRFKLLGPLVGYSAVLGVEFVIREGFEFEESIPFLAWSIARPLGSTRRGAAVHDWAYRHRHLVLKDGGAIPVTRAQADALYREFLLVKGTPAWRANARWAFLRAGGWLAWINNAKKLAALLVALLALPSCSNDIAGISRDDRLTLYGAGLTLAGKPELAAIAYGLRRPVTAPKQPANVQP